MEWQIETLTFVYVLFPTSFE